MSCPTKAHELQDGLNSNIPLGGGCWDGRQATPNQHCEHCGAFVSKQGDPCQRCEQLAQRLATVGVEAEKIAPLLKLSAQGNLSQAQTYLNGSMATPAAMHILQEEPPVTPTVTPSPFTDHTPYQEARAQLIKAMGEQALDADDNLTPAFAFLKGTPLYKMFEQARAEHRHAQNLQDDPDLEAGEMKDGRYTLPPTLQRQLTTLLGEPDSHALGQRLHDIGQQSARLQKQAVQQAVRDILADEGLSHLEEQLSHIASGGAITIEEKKRARTAVRPTRTISEETRQKLREAAKKRLRCADCAAFKAEGMACRRCQRMVTAMQSQGVASAKAERVNRRIGQAIQQIEASYRSRNYTMMKAEAQLYLTQASKPELQPQLDTLLNRALDEKPQGSPEAGVQLAEAIREELMQTAVVSAPAHLPALTGFTQAELRTHQQETDTDLADQVQGLISFGQVLNGYEKLLGNSNGYHPSQVAHWSEAKAEVEAQIQTAKTAYAQNLAKKTAIEQLLLNRQPHQYRNATAWLKDHHEGIESVPYYGRQIRLPEVGLIRWDGANDVPFQVVMTAHALIHGAEKLEAEGGNSSVALASYQPPTIAEQEQEEQLRSAINNGDEATWTRIRNTYDQQLYQLAQVIASEQQLPEALRQGLQLNGRLLATTQRPEPSEVVTEPVDLSTEGSDSTENLPQEPVIEEVVQPTPSTVTEREPRFLDEVTISAPFDKEPKFPEPGFPLRVRATSTQGASQDPQPHTPFTVEHDRDWTWVSFPEAGALSKAERESQYRPTFDQLKSQHRFRYSRKKKGWYARRHIEANQIADLIRAHEPQPATDIDIPPTPQQIELPAQPGVSLPKTVGVSDHFHGQDGKLYQLTGLDTTSQQVSIEADGHSQTITQAQAEELAPHVDLPQSFTNQTGQTISIGQQVHPFADGSSYEVVGFRQTAVSDQLSVILHNRTVGSRHEERVMPINNLTQSSTPIEEGTQLENCAACGAFKHTQKACIRCEQMQTSLQAGRIDSDLAQQLTHQLGTLAQNSEDVDRATAVGETLTYLRQQGIPTTVEQEATLLRAAADYVDEATAVTLRQQLREAGLQGANISSVVEAIGQDHEARVISVMAEADGEKEKAIQTAVSAHKQTRTPPPPTSEDVPSAVQSPLGDILAGTATEHCPVCGAFMSQTAPCRRCAWLKEQLQTAGLSEAQQDALLGLLQDHFHEAGYEPDLDHRQTLQQQFRQWMTDTQQNEEDVAQWNGITTAVTNYVHSFEQSWKQNEVILDEQATNQPPISTERTDGKPLAGASATDGANPRRERDARGSARSGHRGDNPADPTSDASSGGGDVGSVRTSAGDVRLSANGSRSTDTGNRSPHPPVSSPVTNYRISEADELGMGGAKTKYKHNVAAIHLLKQLEAEDRKATPEEQGVLVKYTGWGSMPQAFDIAQSYPDYRTKQKRPWADEYQELQELLTEEEYETARRSTVNAHYTSPEVINGIWQAVQHLGYDGGQVLEPSMGIGHFVGLAPEQLAEQSNFVGVELDDLTGRIAQQLYPNSDVRVQGYQEASLPNNYFDIAIGNVPFGDYGVHDATLAKDEKFLSGRIHNYFFAKALKQTKPGGLVAFVTSRYTLDAPSHQRVREWLASQADLVGAIRLPNDAFKQNAGTEVTTDVIFLRKRLAGEEAQDNSWVKTEKVTMPNSNGVEVQADINSYFAQRPEMMLGRMEATGTMYRNFTPQLVPDKEKPLAEALAQAIQQLPKDVAPRVDLERCPACGAFLPESGVCVNGRCPTLCDVYQPLPADTRLLEGAFVLGEEDGLVYQRVGQSLVRQEATEAELASLQQIREDALNNLPKGAIQNYGTKLQKGHAHLADSPDYQNYVEARTTYNRKQTEQAKLARVKDMLPIRDAMLEAVRLDVSNASDEELAEARAQLNSAYDAFVAKHGYLHESANFRAIADDPNGDRLLALEVGYEEAIKNSKANREKGLTPKPASAKKADIFFKRTIRLSSRPETADSPQDALTISLNEYGAPNFTRMAQLTGLSSDEVAAQLVDEGQLFLTANGRYETRDAYLSGNVRKKLYEAQSAALLDTQYQRNVDALKQVVPERVPAKDIAIQMGAVWIPETDVAQFLSQELFDGRTVDVRRGKENATWYLKPSYMIEQSAANMQEWGIPEAPAMKLIDDLMNSRLTTVYKVVGYDENDRPIRQVDDAKTYDAREKQRKIEEAFKEWLWADKGRLNRLETLYNEEFNALVPRQFDGSHLTFPGLAEGAFGYDKEGKPHQFRPHQKNAIWRTIQNDSTLLAHIVGSGKTATMIASAMEMRRMGTANKPMITVPNHLPQQFADDFRQLYPAANVLVVDSKKMRPSERRKTMNQIVTGDWDAVIISHSAFSRIDVSDEMHNSFVRQEIEQLQAEITELNGMSNGYGFRRGSRDETVKRSIKDLEKAKMRLENKLRDRSDLQREAGTFTFDELGVDALFVDEAHMFKNLNITTKMTRVAGIRANSGSKRAMDMYMKTQYLQSRCHCGAFIGRDGACRNPNCQGTKQVKGKVVFATGTPVTNTMGETYVMQRFLQRDALREAGIESFDAWAKQFGRTVTAIEMKPSGKGFRQKTRFSQFENVPELMRMWGATADIQQDPERLGLPRPLLRGNQDRVAYEAAQKRFLAFAGSDDALTKREVLADAFAHLAESPEYKAFLTAKGDYRKATAVSVPMNDIQREIIEQCDERAENLPQDPREDNMLKVVNDARLASLDPRLLDANYPDDPNSKVNACVRKMIDIYHRTSEIEVAGEAGKQNMAQMLFLDVGTPGGKGFNLYADIKQKLLDEGVPKEEIAFIHDAKTDEAKLDLFKKVNAGEVRFLLGSTEKMGTGTNAQKRLAALHHLDAPWRPDQVEQREGRILRQGNINEEVEIYRYLTEESFDVYMWQTLETKSRFISQVMSGDMSIRSMDDVDETTLGYAEMKAIATGRPEILEKVGVDADLRKLEALATAHQTQQQNMRWRLSRVIPEEQKKQTRYLKQFQEAEERLNLTDSFQATVAGEHFDSSLKAGQRLIDLIEKGKNERGRVLQMADVMQMAGATISLTSNEQMLRRDGRDYGVALIDIGSVRRKVELGPTDKGNMTRIVNELKRLPAYRAEAEEKLAKLAQEKLDLQRLVQRPFDQQSQLEALRQRARELDALIHEIEASEKRQSFDEEE